MVAYTGIQGQNILIVSSDPANPVEGQIWYNSTSNLLKGYQFATVNAWAAGGNLNTGRSALAGGGTQTAGLAFGGNNPGVSSTELYNGTSWTNNPTGLNTARGLLAGATGTQTAALGFGGYVAPGAVSASESFNGSSWTSTPSLNTARYDLSGFGIQTAAVAAGGDRYPGSPRFETATELYNGTSWTSNPTGLNTGRNTGVAFGTQTAGILAGGETITTAVESWNGTTWTTVTSLPSARAQGAAAGIQTAGLVFAGFGPPATTLLASTLLYNGTSWTSNPNSMGTARRYLAGGGTQTAALAFGGTPSPTGAATEEWTGSALQTKTITTS